MTDELKATKRPIRRDAYDLQPKSYTRGFRSMVGKKFGYKSARRSAKTWLVVWEDELVAGDREEGRIG